MPRRDYNYFMCAECKKVTKHIRLSLREFSSAWGDNSTGQRVFDVLADFTGMGDLIEVLGGPKYYKCCECGKPYIEQ